MAGISKEDTETPCLSADSSPVNTCCLKSTTSLREQRSQGKYSLSHSILHNGTDDPIHSTGIPVYYNFYLDRLHLKENPSWMHISTVFIILTWYSVMSWIYFSSSFWLFHWHVGLFTLWLTVSWITHNAIHLLADRGTSSSSSVCSAQTVDNITVKANQSHCVWYLVVY